jgi:hypothetical protein
MSRAGRKAIPDRKIAVGVSIRQSLDNSARERGLDKGAILENAIRLALGTDPEEIEIRRLTERIAALEQELGPAKSRLILLQETISTRRKMETELKLEEDSGPWYLRMLLQDGRIQVIKPHSLDVASIFSGLKERYPEDLDGAALHGNAITFHKTPPIGLGSFLKSKGFSADPKWTRFSYSPPAPRFQFTDDDFKVRYKIAFAAQLLLKDLLSGSVSPSLPVEAFRPYSPHITSNDVKREIKSRMLPEYMQIHVEVER